MLSPVGQTKQIFSVVYSFYEFTIEHLSNSDQSNDETETSASYVCCQEQYGRQHITTTTTN